MNREQEPVVKDSYFRRWFIPVIITILVLCAAAVIITTPPGTPVQWNTLFQATAFPSIK